MGIDSENTWDDETPPAGDDEPSCVDEPMTAEELAWIQKRNPHFQPESRPDDFENQLTDNQVVVLSPFLRMKTPPSVEEVRQIFENHNARMVRVKPQEDPKGYYYTAHDWLSQLCFHRGGGWTQLGIELCKISDAENILPSSSPSDTMRAGIRQRLKANDTEAAEQLRIALEQIEVHGLIVDSTEAI